MPQNPIYDFLKNNGQTTMEEGKFLEFYGKRENAQKIYDNFRDRGLTTVDFDKFYNSYFAKESNKITPTKNLGKQDGTPRDTGSVYNEKTGPIMSKPNSMINQASEYDSFKFLVDPANLVDKSQKRVTQSTPQDGDTKMFENEMTKFNRNLLVVDGQEIFPEQDPNTKQWYYTANGKRKDLQDNPIKEGSIIKVKPENQWFYSQQYDYRYKDPMSSRNGKNIPVKYLQYSNGKYTPVEKPVSTKPEELAPAFVTAQVKPTTERRAKPNTVPKGFSSDLYNLAKNQGGAAEFQRLLNLNPTIADNINKRIGELGQSYMIPASENPKEAKRLLTEAVLMSYNAKYDGFDNDIKLVTNAEDIIHSYQVKQEALNSRLQFLTRDVFDKNGMKAEFDQYMSLSKKLKNNPIAIDAMDYFTIVNKTNSNQQLTPEEQTKWTKLQAKKFNPESDKVKDVINSVQAYQELSKKVTPLFEQVNQKSKRIGELFQQNNKEFEKFKSDYTNAGNRISSNVDKQEDLQYALDIVNNRIFKKQNILDKKQQEFDERAGKYGTTIGQDVSSFFGAAVKGLMGMSKSIADVSAGLANAAMRSQYGGINYDYITSNSVDRWYEKNIPTVNSKFQSVSQEYRQQALRTGKKLSPMHSQDIATTLGDMVPTIAASVLTEGIASAVRGAAVAEGVAAKGIIDKIGLDKITTFASTMATTAPRFYEEGRAMRLKGNALHLYAIGSSGIESLTESFLTIDEMIKAGKSSHIGSSIMKDLLAGKISKTNLNDYAFEKAMKFVKDFMVNGSIEEAENITSNVLTPVLNMLVNKVEARKDKDGNDVDVASTDFEITNLDEIITTFGVTLLPSAGRSVLPGGTFFDMGVAYSGIPESIRTISLKMYQNSPSMVDKMISRIEDSGNTELANNLSDLLTNFENKLNSMPENITDEQKIVVFGITEKMNKIDGDLQSTTDPAVSLSLKKSQADLQKQLDEAIANPQVAEAKVQPVVQQAEDAITESLDKAQKTVNLRFGTQPVVKESAAVSTVAAPEMGVTEMGTTVIKPSTQKQQTYQISPGVSVTSTQEMEKRSSEKRIQIQNPHKPSFNPTQKVEENTGDIVTETQLADELADSNAKEFFDVKLKKMPRKTKNVTVNVSDANGNQTKLTMSPQQAQSMLKKRNFDLLNILNCVLK